MREQKPKEQFSPVDFVSGSFMGISPACIKKLGTFGKIILCTTKMLNTVSATNKGLSVGTSTKLVYRHNESSDSMFLQKTIPGTESIKILERIWDRTTKSALLY